MKKARSSLSGHLLTESDVAEFRTWRAARDARPPRLLPRLFKEAFNAFFREANGATDPMVFDLPPLNHFVDPGNGKAKPFGDLLDCQHPSPPA
jgi:hypothetical protein